jgi:hypothetical protein
MTYKTECEGEHFRSFLDETSRKLETNVLSAPYFLNRLPFLTDRRQEQGLCDADTSNRNDNNQPDYAWPAPPLKKARRVYSEADAK